MYSTHCIETSERLYTRYETGDSFHTAVFSRHTQTCRHAAFILSDWGLCLKLSFKQESQDPTYPSIKISTSSSDLKIEEGSPA